MNNPLSRLKLEYWYHVLLVASLVVFLATGLGLLKAFPTAPTALISLGTFWIGLGEWVNHPLKTAIVSGSAYFPAGKLTGHPRSARPLGVAFDLLGGVLVLTGLYKLL